MFDALSRRFFLSLSHSPHLKRAVSRYGMRGSDSFARRFIGGETLDEAVGVLHDLGRRGFTHTLNYLGEHVATPEAAADATQHYLHTITTVGRAGLPCKVSVKLSQIGLDVDRSICLDNLQQILSAAAHEGGFVRVDMEGSATVDATLELVETMWREGRQNVGVVLQAYLRRTHQDLERMLSLGARVRLCKGAYKEPAEVAYQDKPDVDDAFLSLMRRLVAHGQTPAFATHDPRMIDETRRFAAEQGIGPDGFEFQMLYGVRRDLQARLRDAGYGMRIYVPYGVEWFPYFMRRLAERPANVSFVVRSLVYEQMGKQTR